MPPQDPPDFREGLPFLGGSLWIDLLNTTPVIDGRALDLIAEAEALRRWARIAGRDPGPQLPADVEAAHSLRDSLRDAFTALAAAQPVPAPSLADLNAALDGIITRRQIIGDRVTALRAVSGPGVAAMVADDLADFLGGFEPRRLRHCSNPACTMVFYDRGKNNRRRWCSMQACGNREKVATYRERKAAREGPTGTGDPAFDS